MIYYDNQFEKMEMTCDHEDCQKTDDFWGDWMECIEEAKSYGWIVKKLAEGMWAHFCSKEHATIS